MHYNPYLKNSLNRTSLICVGYKYPHFNATLFACFILTGWYKNMQIILCQEIFNFGGRIQLDGYADYILKSCNFAEIDDLRLKCSN